MKHSKLIGKQHLNDNFISFLYQFTSVCLILINIWEELTFNFIDLSN